MEIKEYASVRLDVSKGIIVHNLIKTKKRGLKGEFMKKVLNKNRLFYAIMFSLIFIVILIMGIVLLKSLF